MKSGRIIRILLAAGLFAMVCTSAFAKGKPGSNNGTPVTMTFSTQLLSTFTTYSVKDDGNGAYYNLVDGVQSYIGVAGKDLDLVTYDTPRKLHFKFNPKSAAWQASGIPEDFTTVVDFYGINYYGQYMSQGIGTTAQVQGTLQFYVGRVTYELDYQSLACYRENDTTFLITSEPYPYDPLIPYGFPGFTASNQAALNSVRRRSVTKFGTVNMPIRFEVTLQ